VLLRPARPDDYDAIAAVLDDWWERPIRVHLPRLFLDHFHLTSLIAERPDAGSPAGFLVGFLSPARTDEAYVHFVGVAPAHRRTGLAHRLYQAFFELAREHGRDVVRAVTSPANTRSIAFHRAIGFQVTEPTGTHIGPGEAMVRLARRL